MILSDHIRSHRLCSYISGGLTRPDVRRVEDQSSSAKSKRSTGGKSLPKGRFDSPDPQLKPLVLDAPADHVFEGEDLGKSYMFKREKVRSVTTLVFE